MAEIALEKHYVNRIGWLRAVVLGANDGILSTTSIVIGVAAADTTLNAIVLAALAGMIAGALSMAAGEYVSVSCIIPAVLRICSWSTAAMLITVITGHLFGVNTA
ncbi:MAG: hypothetical protein BGP13_15615 [Sphingobacteriales bacterium 40-81]|nr:MAG: hypothetical protein BGP13_15615 [Sphingobacteriales bacterium 40-81]